MLRCIEQKHCSSGESKRKITSFRGEIKDSSEDISSDNENGKLNKEKTQLRKRGDTLPLKLTDLNSF
jgi:hypothetical protein